LQGIPLTPAPSTIQQQQTAPSQKPILASSVSNIMVQFRRLKIGAESMFLSTGG
jgi:hypothetical protein